MRVDPVACDGFGYCSELVPELIWLDEWGYPVLDDAEVPPQLMDLAGQAVQTCPRKALLLEKIVVEAPRTPVARRRATNRPSDGRAERSNPAVPRRRIRYPAS